MEYVVTILLQLGVSKLLEIKLGDIFLSKFAIFIYVMLAMILLADLLNDNRGLDDEEKNPLGISEFDANAICVIMVFSGLAIFLVILMLIFR